MVNSPPGEFIEACGRPPSAVGFTELGVGAGASPAPAPSPSSSPKATGGGKAALNRLGDCAAKNPPDASTDRAARRFRREGSEGKPQATAVVVQTPPEGGRGEAMQTPEGWPPGHAYWKAEKGGKSATGI